MAAAFTSKNYQIKKAPKRIELLGDKTRRPEPAQHIIEFPGGAIELSRTTDGSYWAHILIHRGEPLDDAEGYHSVRGEIVGSRIHRSHPGGTVDIEGEDAIEQIAVLIRPATLKRAGEAGPPSKSRATNRSGKSPDRASSVDPESNDDPDAERGFEP